MMHRKIMLGTVAAAGLMLLAACNQETASDTPANAPTSSTQAANAPPTDTSSATSSNAPADTTNTAVDNAPSNQTAQNEPAPGSRNETVSATKDAVAGAVGTISAELTTSTKGFVDDAAIGDMYEVQAGQIALMRAKSPDVKMFAQKMIDDHTKSTNQLKTILAKASPNFMPPMQIDSRREGLLNDLKGAKDQDFEGRYIAQQINAHDEAVILIRGYANSGDNPDIKTFAMDILPTVQMHQDMIKEIDRTHRAGNAQARNSGNSDSKTR
jgi:putative membrane protein